MQYNLKYYYRNYMKKVKGMRSQSKLMMRSKNLMTRQNQRRIF